MCVRVRVMTATKRACIVRDYCCLVGCIRPSGVVTSISVVDTLAMICPVKCVVRAFVCSYVSLGGGESVERV